MKYLSYLVLIAAILTTSRVRAQTDSNIAYGRLSDAYGIRLGIVGNWLGNHTPALPNPSDAIPLGSGVRPSLEPFYEANLEPGLMASASLMLVYRSFAALDFSDIRFESYGFNLSVRWEPAVTTGVADRYHLYFQPGIGFDTFDDRVSLSFPLRMGELMPLGARTEFELGALVVPELFLGLGPGMYYGITAAIRFLNPR